MLTLGRRSRGRARGELIALASSFCLASSGSSARPSCSARPGTRSDGSSSRSPWGGTELTGQWPARSHGSTRRSTPSVAAWWSWWNARLRGRDVRAPTLVPPVPRRTSSIARMAMGVGAIWAGCRVARAGSLQVGSHGAFRNPTYVPSSSAPRTGSSSRRRDAPSFGAALASIGALIRSLSAVGRRASGGCRCAAGGASSSLGSRPSGSYPRD